MKDDSDYKKLGELRVELNVYNKTINNYINTFNLNLTNSKYIFDTTNSNELRDYFYIKPELENYLLSIKNDLLDYEKDFYKLKKPIDISEKIGIGEDEIISFLNEWNEKYMKGSEIWSDFIDTNDFKNPYFINLNHDGKITKDTYIKEFSSFQILKEINSK